MTGDFLDTSALAKRYHTEAGSAEIDRLWGEAGLSLFISRLAIVEIASVFGAKVRSGVVSYAEFESMRRRFMADVPKTKRITVARVLGRHYLAAEKLLRVHAPFRRLRALDALQIAVALDLRRVGNVARVVSSDIDMLDVAAREGLDTFNPQKP